MVIDVKQALTDKKKSGPVKEKIIIETKKLNFYYVAGVPALKNIDINIPKKRVTAFIGPSGCGKSTLLRCFNRMNDLIPGSFLEGKIMIEGEDVLLTLALGKNEIITSQITYQSYKNLKIKKDDELLAIFKAYSITLLK